MKGWYDYHKKPYWKVYFDKRGLNKRLPAVDFLEVVFVYHYGFWNSSGHERIKVKISKVGPRGRGSKRQDKKVIVAR